MSGRKNPRLNIPIPVRQQTQLYRLPLPPQSTAVSKDVADLSDLERIQTLGHGSGGNVYKVRHSKTSALYALKVIHGNPDETVRRQIIREMEILKKTESPYIVKCHGVFEKGEEIHFVLEYMDGGSLEQRRSDMRSEKFLAQVARQVLEGLKYLHSHKIVHRDIKPSNLLINKKQEVKIADFGVSRILSQTLDPCNTYVGTCAYMSPERFDPETYGGRYDGYAGDIWSLGLSLLECYIGHFPFLAPGQKPDWPALMCAICYGDPPSPPPTASANFRSFINCCLHKDARNRWTAAQLLGHPFILSSSPQEKFWIFVLEYMDGGSLEQRRSGMMSEKFLAQVARQVLEGLKYLHRHKIVHRDIKPSNLLINKKQEVKIADFGVWYSNVPHTRLVEDKGGQNWIVLDKDKFKFPGGGTQFIHGADHYIDQIAQVVPSKRNHGIEEKHFHQSCCHTDRDHGVNHGPFEHVRNEMASWNN